MSRWSESVYSEPNSARSSHQGFLGELDACLYEGVPMQDPLLDAEAREWAARFVHLRVLGAKCGIPSTKSQNDNRLSSNATQPPFEKTTPTPSRTEANTLTKLQHCKKNSKSAPKPRSVSDHLPKLSNVKRSNTCLNA
ncbi:unnamed protein product [Cylicocyclus nassatus]|uniref:DUF3719 domain-containing protein n=1 Tax=Cylicocyclus nassatus TaxID=53992 RepID=A0AA36H4C5_CYLNA|nr:unnamed protein product [Cylicocyclus nassatus]